jgi:hypothetical protein
VLSNDEGNRFEGTDSDIESAGEFVVLNARDF